MPTNYKTILCLKKLLVLSEACKNNKCAECTGIINQSDGQVLQCEHEHHLNTLPTTETLNESLQQQTTQHTEERIQSDLPHPL